MRRAVVDIGTNTVKLLVADVTGPNRIVPVLANDVTTRLGEGLVCSLDNAAPQRLLPEAITRTCVTVAAFQREARSLGATDVIAVATSAVRDAVNRSEFLNLLREVAGLEARVLTGDDEARLIFMGVNTDPAWSGAALLVMDVGGGSAELIQGEGGRVQRHASWPIGAVRLKEQFGEGRWDAMRVFLRERFVESLRGFEAAGRRMIATGGGINVCARMRAGKSDGVVMDREWLREAVDRLERMPLEERRKAPGVPAERADIIVPGGAVFAAAMDVLGATEMTVSTRSLRFGVLADTSEPGRVGS